MGGEMLGTEKLDAVDDQPIPSDAPPVADLSDEEIKTAFDELVAQIDAEQQRHEP